jgi:hypothetical protein
VSWRSEKRRRQRERRLAAEREAEEREALRARLAEKLTKIDETARERQGSWQEKGRSDVTDFATAKLAWLFDGVRADRREAYAYGEPEGSAYRGRTSRLRRLP